MKRRIFFFVLVACSVILTGCGGGSDADGAADVNIITTTMPNAIQNEEYLENIEVTGGQGNYTVTVISGDLPTGLTLSPRGTVSGVPTDPLATYAFTVKAEDRDLAEIYDEQEITITVKLMGSDDYESDDDFNTKNTITLDGVEQTHTIDKDGQDCDYIKLDLSGDQRLKIQTCFASVPTDTLIRIYNANGDLLATDDNAGSDLYSRIEYDFSVGVYFIMIRAADGEAGNYRISVMPAMSITTQGLPSCIQGEAYNAQIAASGGVEDTEYSFSLVSGNLPADLTLSSDGAVSGTATDAVGTYTVTVQVEDKNNVDNHATKELSVDVQLTGADNHEPDDDFNTENTITYDGVSQTHTIDKDGEDCDYIKLDLTNISIHTKMVIETGFLSFDTNTLITIYDANGELLATDDNSGTNLYSTIAYEFSEGVYYIMISAADGEPGDYTISVRLNFSDIKIIVPTYNLLTEGFAGNSYYDKIQVEGGTGCYVYSLVGSLPEGLSLDPATGEVAGILDPATQDVYSFDVMVEDLYYPDDYSNQRNVKLPVYQCRGADDEYRWIVWEESGCWAGSETTGIGMRIYWDAEVVFRSENIDATSIGDYGEEANTRDNYCRGEFIEEKLTSDGDDCTRTRYYEVSRCRYPGGTFGCCE